MISVEHVGDLPGLPCSPGSRSTAWASSTGPVNSGDKLPMATVSPRPSSDENPARGGHQVNPAVVDMSTTLTAKQYSTTQHPAQDKRRALDPGRRPAQLRRPAAATCHQPGQGPRQGRPATCRLRCLRPAGDRWSRSAHPAVDSSPPATRATRRQLGTAATADPRHQRYRRSDRVVRGAARRGGCGRARRQRRPTRYTPGRRDAWVKVNSAGVVGVPGRRLNGRSTWSGSPWAQTDSGRHLSCTSPVDGTGGFRCRPVDRCRHGAGRGLRRGPRSAIGAAVRASWLSAW